MGLFWWSREAGSRDILRRLWRVYFKDALNDQFEKRKEGET